MAFIQSSMRWPWFLETAESKIQITPNLSNTSCLQVQLLHMRLHQVQWALVIKGATFFGTAENNIQIAANLSTTSCLQVQFLHMRPHQVQWAFVITVVIKGATLS
jgi:hypothetical protein